MKKKLMILFGILAILFLQACMENFDEGSGRASTQAFSEPYLTEDSGGDFEKYQGVRMIKEQQYNPWAVTKNGCYEISKEAPYNIYYTDISEGQRDILPVQLDLSYISENGTNWDILAGEAPNVFAIEDSLYMVTDGNNYVPGFLYRLDPVKGKHEKLAEFEGCHYFENSVASDGEAFYMIYRNLSGDGLLIKVLIKEKRVEELHKFSHTQSVIKSAFDDCLIIESSDSPSAKDCPDYNERLEQTEYVLYRYSLQNGKIEKLSQWQYHHKSIGYKAQNAYAFDSAADCLKVIDLENDKEKILIEAFSECGIEIGDIAEITDIRENKIIIQCQKGQYVLDIDKLIIKRLRPLNGVIYPEIIGAYGDKYLIPTNWNSSVEALRIFTGKDKDIIKLALIDKDDFWKQRYRFQEIEDVFLEADKSR